MGLFNRVFTAIFDVLLAPFGLDLPAVNLLVWPVLGGVIALLVYKAVSNQAGIARAKNGIQVHLLEVVLYKDDLVGVVASTARALAKNVLYVGYNVVPMVVMFVPMTIVLVQLVSNYAYAPVKAGDVATLFVQLDREAASVPVRDVTLELPEGVVLDAPPVRTPDGEIAWRLRAEAPGDHVLRVHAGPVTEAKTLSVGGDPRKVSPLRTKSWEALLYPSEAVPAADSPVYSLRIDHPTRPLDVFPDGEDGILLWFFAASLGAGLLLKDRFGVTL